MSDKVKRGLKFVVIYGLCVVIGLLIGEYLIPNIPDFEQSFGFVWFFILIMVISLFMSIAIHELGHFIMGRLTGYRFFSFRLFSFMIEIQPNHRLKFMMMKAPGMSGQCLMTPDENRVMPIFWYHFGGVLFNLLFFVLAFGIFLLNYSSKINLWMMLTMVFNGFLAVTNWISFKNLQNDGKNYREMKANPVSREAIQRMLLIIRDLNHGKRISELTILPVREQLSYKYLIQARLLLLHAIKDLFQNNVDSFLSEMDRYERSIGTQTGIHVNVMKPYLYFAHLLKDQARAIETKDKITQTIISTCKREPFFALIMYYEAFLKNDKNAISLKIKLVKTCQNANQKGEVLDILDLLWRLENKALDVQQPAAVVLS
jgi:hypothetical protein